MRHNIIIIILLALISALTACSDHQEKPITIGIVEPIEHTALNEIVAGFKETLKDQYRKPLIIKVENAQNDMNLERAIFQKMKDAHYDIVVPLGTSASQMAVNMLPNQTVVSLASSLSEKDRTIAKRCNVAVVRDDISGERLLSFVKNAFPNIKTIMLIHSADEKVFKEVADAQTAGRKVGIQVSNRMVTTLSELYPIARSLPANIDAILILKDNMIASGASTLAQVAQQKHIPFIASDEGSVLSGADIALGVREKQIGIEGGKLAARILQGKKPCDLPIVEMTVLSVFVNPAHAVVKENMSSIQKTVSDLHYSMLAMHEKNEG